MFTLNRKPVTQPAPSRPGNGAEANLAGSLNNLANAVSNADVINRGELHDLIAKPHSTTMTVTSDAGGGAGNVTAYMFNEDFLNQTTDDNGSGAGTVVKTYSDGFSGNLINRVIAAKNDAGLPLKQLQFKYIITASGLQDPTAIQNANPVLTTYNGDQSSLPQSIPLSTTGTPAYQQDGFLIINIKGNIKRYSQISYVVPAGRVATVIAVYGY